MNKFTVNIFFAIILFFSPVLYSFTPDGVKVFRDSNSTIYLKLPDDWSSQLHEDENMVQMFVSRERELFTAGIIITKIYNVPSVYKINIKSNNELVNYWSSRLSKASEQYVYSEEISSGKYSSGHYSGIKREFLHKYNDSMDPVHTYTLVLADKGNIITLVAVAPEAEWNDYKPVFETAIQSLDLK